MDSCRPEWSTDFKNWILSLIAFSLKSSVAKYNDSWWRQKNGIPTGGSLCVQLANIAVFFVMSKKVYEVPDMMTYIREVRRFIDDGAGFHVGSEEDFRNWLSTVNTEIGPLGLNIDESTLKKNSNYINFLDIQYCFDENGYLQTDLFRKETDSQAFLNFSSSHPKHTFSGNVYSQALRLRRIINSRERLELRLKELAESFEKAGYPKQVIQNIKNKVLNSERDISIKRKVAAEDDGKIIVVSTFEADDNIVSAVKESEDIFKRTQSFRTQNGPLFKYVKKVGPNIRSHINTMKKQALGIKRGEAKMCLASGCKTCRMILKKSEVMVGNRKIKLCEGNCKTYNICYLALCSLCEKPYTGRTVGPLHKRANGHRDCYKEVLKQTTNASSKEIDQDKDLYTLGIHLHHDHGLTDPTAFDKYIKFGILDVVSPADIDVKEYTWMHRLNTFQPVGLNIEYPFGIPFLGQ